MSVTITYRTASGERYGVPEEVAAAQDAIQREAFEADRDGADRGADKVWGHAAIPDLEGVASDVLDAALVVEDRISETVESGRLTAQQLQNFIAEQRKPVLKAVETKRESVERSIDFLAEKMFADNRGAVAYKGDELAEAVQTLDNGQPVSEFTVSREMGHSSPAMVRAIYGQLGTVRHRSQVVEYRVSQHMKVEGYRDRVKVLREKGGLKLLA